MIIPQDALAQLKLPDFSALFAKSAVWKSAVVLFFVATLKTLLSIEAVDKIDPQNRVTPQNRELVAQGIGNIASGLIGGILPTSVIVRSAANAEAGARSRLSSFLHGMWLLAGRCVRSLPGKIHTVLCVGRYPDPYGYGLARPSMIIGGIQTGP